MPASLFCCLPSCLPVFLIVFFSILLLLFFFFCLPCLVLFLFFCFPACIPACLHSCLPYLPCLCEGFSFFFLVTPVPRSLPASLPTCFHACLSILFYFFVILFLLCLPWLVDLHSCLPYLPWLCEGFSFFFSCDSRAPFPSCFPTDLLPCLPVYFILFFCYFVFVMSSLTCWPAFLPPLPSLVVWRFFFFFFLWLPCPVPFLLPYRPASMPACLFYFIFLLFCFCYVFPDLLTCIPASPTFPGCVKVFLFFFLVTPVPRSLPASLPTCFHVCLSILFYCFVILFLLCLPWLVVFLSLSRSLSLSLSLTHTHTLSLMRVFYLSL